MALDRTGGFFAWLVAAIALAVCAAARPQGVAPAGGQPPGGSPALPPTGAGAPPATGAAPANSANQAPDSKASDDQMPDALFDKLDRNHDKVIVEAELKAPEASRYVERLKQADQNKDGRITREEFDRARLPPFYRDPSTAAILLLMLGFAAFCMFLDGFLEPDRRDYFWLALAGCLAGPGLAYLFAASWFLNESPFLGYVAVVPVLLLVAAWLSGATKEVVTDLADLTKQVVYKVGTPTASAGKGTSAGAGGPNTTSTGGPPSGAAPPRRPAPQRTPRPAPLPRPSVPERRPPPAQRPQPPRPPGAAPPGGTKPPPGGAKPPPAKG